MLPARNLHLPSAFRRCGVPLHDGFDSHGGRLLFYFFSFSIQQSNSLPLRRMQRPVAVRSAVSVNQNLIVALQFAGKLDFGWCSAFKRCDRVLLFWKGFGS